MILIVSTEYDYSTNDVIDWLLYYKRDCLRINSEDCIYVLNTRFISDKVDFDFSFKDSVISLSDIKSFWYRRGRININSLNVENRILDKDLLKDILSHMYNEEEKTLHDFLISQLETKNSLGSYFGANANKLTSLYIAQKVGLKIPNTIISSTKKDLLNFYDKNNSIISKGIQDIISFAVNDKGYSNKTEIVCRNDIEEMNDNFFPSLLQMNVKKRYELRVFYLRGVFYSMSIFSQNDEQTKVDFRDYNIERPNRTVPYKLPKDIEDKLSLFMSRMELDTGSIDIIVTPDMEYVFLEVNPVGQYGMTSLPCNYYLDEKIAKCLDYV
jgi:ATP-GRASP peptide maturase of grasp-with-spasm system